MSAPRSLAHALLDADQGEYVRVVAHWLTDADSLDEAPALTGVVVIDALVGAAAAHLRLRAGQDVPGWTLDGARRVPYLWYPGPDVFFAHALVHSPAAFRDHGVLIEAESLISV